MNMPIAPIITQDRVQALAWSALPDAPVVDDAPRRRPVHAARSLLARSLHAAAGAVAPPEPRSSPRRSDAGAAV
jgi:hypothetical protein